MPQASAAVVLQLWRAPRSPKQPPNSAQPRPTVPDRRIWLILDCRSRTDPFGGNVTSKRAQKREETGALKSLPGSNKVWYRFWICYCKMVFTRSRCPCRLNRPRQNNCFINSPKFNQPAKILYAIERAALRTTSIDLG